MRAVVGGRCGLLKGLPELQTKGREQVNRTGPGSDGVESVKLWVDKRLLGLEAPGGSPALGIVAVAAVSRVTPACTQECGQSPGLQAMHGLAPLCRFPPHADLLWLHPGHL